MEIPKDVPDLVASSPDNVDLDRLRKDIPKFLNNSRVISTEQKEWWDTFFENALETYQVSPEKPSWWLLDEVKHLKARSTNTVGIAPPRSLSSSDVPVEPICSDATEKAAELVNAQFDDIPEVWY